VLRPGPVRPFSNFPSFLAVRRYGTIRPGFVAAPEPGPYRRFDGRLVADELGGGFPLGARIRTRHKNFETGELFPDEFAQRTHPRSCRLVVR